MEASPRLCIRRMRERSEWRPRKSTQQANADWCLLGPRCQWLVVRRFVSASENAALLQKAITHMHRNELHPNPAGPNRFFAKVDDAPELYVDALLESLKRRCERCLGLERVPADCVLGRTISLILPGGRIHRHTDAYIAGQPGHRPGLEHVRCNIVVRLSHPSGRPVIDGAPLIVDECDLWAFFASRCPHETVTLQGCDPRIVFGFGWSVPQDYELRLPRERSSWYS